MPFTYIPNIGNVDYETKALPADIKGKSYIGLLHEPILINENLGPGAKLNYVVAHEVGHRLTLDMIINADKETPFIFENAPDPLAGLVRYFIDLGLSRNDMQPVHPGTLKAIDRIFKDNAEGKYTDDMTAREFIAEVYAQWATNTGTIPEAIAKRFRLLTKSKNEILRSKVESQAAFLEPSGSVTVENKYIIGALIGVVAWIVIKDI